MKLTPKTIFIWRGYGDISVYHVDTQDKYDALFSEVKTVCEQLDSASSLSNVKSIIGLIDAIGGVGCHETFEDGTGWGKLQ